MEHVTNGRTRIQCSQCGKIFIKWRCDVAPTNYCKQSCYFAYIKSGKHTIIGQSAQKHPNWQGGRSFINVDGYRFVWAFNHPRAHQNVVAEHILVMERKIGRPLRKGEEIHHINGMRDDNRPENLELCINHSNHLAAHKHKLREPQKKDIKTGRFI